MTTDHVATALANATPVEVDSALAEIYGRYYAAQDKAAQHQKYAKDLEQGLAKYAAGNLSYSGYKQSSLDEQIALRDKFRALAAQIITEANPFEDEYLRRPWTRFFLVKNNGGHIHSSMSCQTCNKRGQATRFGWLPELSGLTEAEAVAAHGAILCTVCYPSAPLHWTDRRDPNACAGSGSYLNRDLPHRTGFYTGNWGTCETCGKDVTLSSANKLRKHKP